MYKVLNSCPVCDSKLTVERLKCNKCSTVVENKFYLSKFDYLSEEQLRFVETFVRCSGSIKEVEKELGISYPTVKAKLNDVINEFDKIDKNNKQHKINFKPDEIFEFIDPSKHMNKSPEDIQKNIEEGLKHFKNGVTDVINKAFEAGSSVINKEQKQKTEEPKVEEQDEDVTKILDSLEKGEISAEEALRRMKK